MKLRNRLFVFGALAIVALVILWLLSRPPMAVDCYTRVRYADIVSTITISGKMSPCKEVEIKPHIAAYVSNVFVRCSDKVKKGQRLMTLKAIPDVFALEQADAAIELEKIALKQAQTDFERAEKLFAGKSISTKEYEMAVNALDIAKEHLKLAQNKRNIIVNGGSERSPQHNESVVLSPVSGIVSEIPVTEGETVSPFGLSSFGTTLCKIANDGPLVFKGNVDETDIPFVHSGMTVNLVLGAFPDTVIPAQISSVSSFGKAQSGSTQFEMEASLTSLTEGIELRSGFSANVKIETDRVQHVLSVPEECIRFDENRTPYVLRLTSTKKKLRHQSWEKVPVTTGISNGLIIQITSGLEENDIVQTLNKK